MDAKYVFGLVSRQLLIGKNGKTNTNSLLAAFEQFLRYVVLLLQLFAFKFMGNKQSPSYKDKFLTQNKRDV